MSLSKICLHWSAGASYPCEVDLKAYHFLVDKDGKVYAGHFKPECNIICKPNQYAMHCGGGNTGCIGLSVLGMAGFNLKDKKTKYPLTKIQVEAFCKLAAELCIKYGIKVSPETVFTHHEFGLKHPKTTSYGKIDFTYLPFLPNIAVEKGGDYLRNKIDWYLIQIKEGKINI